MTYVMKKNLWEIMVGAALAMLLIIPMQLFSLVDDIKRLQASNTEPEDYFIVRGVTVEDAQEGEQPSVVYDRTVVRPFRAKWIAGVFSLPDQDGINYGVCNGSGDAEYKPDVKLPPAVTLKWFIERDCKLEPGRYVLKTTWEIKLDHGINKYVRATSNVFEISPKPEP
jgi:hypothetical protein